MKSDVTAKHNQFRSKCQHHFHNIKDATVVSTCLTWSDLVLGVITLALLCNSLVC